jgi:GNAT superfamily N-acetyltransferase
MSNSTCRSAHSQRGDGEEAGDTRVGAPPADRADDYTCVVTGYAGFESHILRLRNANRSDVKSRRYFDWRYRRFTDVPEPKVFWLVSGSGERVGMASVIWRPYWTGRVRTPIAVLGDISLDSSLRGKGLGRFLLHFVTRYLERAGPEGTALVIPTEAARQSLAAVGWQTKGRLIPHVLLLNPASKLRGLGRSARPGSPVARGATSLLSGFLGRHVRRDAALDVVDGADASCEVLWQETERDNAISRDRSLVSLSWRYADHPSQKFSVAKMTRGAHLIGYAVFSVDPQEQLCVVYDLVVREDADVTSLLALLGQYCIRQGEISTIRLVLNDEHPYRQRIWRLGFIARGAAAAFQVYSPGDASAASRCTPKWIVTAGDKDI